MTIFQFSRACSHYDVIYKWLVLTLVSMKRSSVMTFSIDNPEGGCNNSPSENMFGKNPQENKGNVNITVFSCLQHLFINFPPIGAI